MIRLAGPALGTLHCFVQSPELTNTGPLSQHMVKAFARVTYVAKIECVFESMNYAVTIASR